MTIKIITNEQEYDDAMERLVSLTERDPIKNSDVIGVLSLLIADYEEKNAPIDLPDPLSAIEFRMEQQNLTKADMVKYLGSKSRVSEILGRKKRLSLSMIKALNEGLGISFDVLMQEQELKAEQKRDFNEYPLSEMNKNGYFGKVFKTIADVKKQAEKLVEEKLSFVGLKPFEETELHCKTSAHTTNKKMNLFALTAWQSQVLGQAKNSILPPCDLTQINLSFMKDVLKLSRFEDGPIRAKQKLAKHGIHLIFEKHLAKTYLDGAAMKGVDGNPVIGMTIRYDRLDNFWFVLMHELAHVSLHLKDSQKIFFDDLEGKYGDDKHEDEADELALEALMSQEDWLKYFDILETPNSIITLAKKYSVNPAIIAGRYRKEAKDYRIFNRLIGSKKVKNMIF